MLIHHYHPINTLHLNLTISPNNVTFTFLVHGPVGEHVPHSIIMSIQALFSLWFLTSFTPLLFSQFKKIWRSACVHPMFWYDRTLTMHPADVCQTSPRYTAECETLFRDTVSTLTLTGNPL